MMLAQKGSVADIRRLQDKGYLFDLKIDGVRCHAAITAGVVRLTTRQGVDVTGCYPEVVEALAGAYPSGRWTFDGEIAVDDERGLPSWPLTQKRIAQSEKRASYWAQRLRVTFYIFDVLVAEQDVSGLAYANRRQILQVEAAKWEPPLSTVLHSPDGDALWAVVTTHELEGIIAKKPTAPYRQSRTTDWVKIKRTRSASFLVGGTSPGEGGRRSTFGNLLLYLLDSDGKLTPEPVGKVGSGFSNADLHKVMQALHHPPVIVEVEYLGVSPDGILRQPVFKGIRTDVAVTDCTMDQLT